MFRGDPARVSRLEKELQKTRQELADFNDSVAVESPESDEDTLNKFWERADTGYYTHKDLYGYGPVD